MTTTHVLSLPDSKPFILEIDGYRQNWSNINARWQTCLSKETAQPKGYMVIHI